MVWPSTVALHPFLSLCTIKWPVTEKICTYLGREEQSQSVASHVRTHKEKNCLEWPTLAVPRALPKCIPQSLAVGSSRYAQEEGGWNRGIEQRGRESTWLWVSGAEALKVLIRCMFWANNRIHRKGNGLHSSSEEVQTALRSKFSYILFAQYDKTAKSVLVCI